MVVASAPSAAAAKYPPGVGIRLLDASVSRRNDPRAHSSIDDFVHPGVVFTRHFLVSNGDSRPFTVKLYVRPAQLVGGNFAIDDKSPGEIPQWVTLDKSSATIPSQSAVTVAATFRVPASASKGEYYGALLAELPPPPGTKGVGVASRVGIRVYLDVGPGGEPRSDFTIDTLTAARNSDGAPVVTAQVHNTGGRALDMSGSLKLSDGPGGLSAGPFSARLGTTLAPGQTEPVTVILDKSLPDGPWKARIDLQSGQLKRAAEGTITFPTAAGTSSSPVAAKNISLAKNRNFLIPLAILLLLGIAIGIFLLFWKRRKRKEEEEEPS
jgi:hypothetical protein